MAFKPVPGEPPLPLLSIDERIEQSDTILVVRFEEFSESAKKTYLKETKKVQSISGDGYYYVLEVLKGDAALKDKQILAPSYQGPIIAHPLSPVVTTQGEQYVLFATACESQGSLPRFRYTYEYGSILPYKRASHVMKKLKSSSVPTSKTPACLTQEELHQNSAYIVKATLIEFIPESSYMKKDKEFYRLGRYEIITIWKGNDDLNVGDHFVYDADNGFRIFSPTPHPVLGNQYIIFANPCTHQDCSEVKKWTAPVGTNKYCPSIKNYEGTYSEKLWGIDKISMSKDTVTMHHSIKENPCESWKEKVEKSDFIISARLERFLEDFEYDTPHQNRVPVPTDYIVEDILKGDGSLKIGDHVELSTYPYSGLKIFHPKVSPKPEIGKTYILFAQRHETSESSGNHLKIAPQCGGILQTSAEKKKEILELINE